MGSPLSPLRKFAAVPFALGLLLGVGGTAFGATLLGSSTFSDVQPGSYYDAAIGRLVDQGVIGGFPDGTFRPGQLVSRADVAVMIDRAFNGSDIGSGASSSRRPRSSSSRSSSSSSSSVNAEAGSIHFTTTGFNVGQESKRATITVVRTGGKKGEVKADYAFGNGTAVLNTDYTASTGTLTFADGETTKNISVSITRAEGSPTKTLEVTLSNARVASLGTPATATLTLLGSGTASSSSTASSTSSVAGAGSFAFTASTYSVDENAGALSITVRRTNGSSSSATVNYATSNGTATAGTNYAATQGTLNFGPGETTKTFSVQVTDNSAIDGNRMLNLTLSAPTGGANIIAPSTATLTLVDNETTPSAQTGSIVYSASSYTVLESGGSVTVTVQRKVSNLGTVNVNYATYDGSATQTADYTATQGTLTFAPGEMSKTFVVPILKDSNTEAEETINLTLNTLTGPATLGEQSTATIRIQ